MAVLENVEFEGERLRIDTDNWRYSRLLQLQLAAAFLVFVLFGLGEQTVDTLIPELQAYYSINDRSISYVFFMSVSGYLVMAIINNITHEKLGVGGVAVMGATSMTSAYLVLSMKPSFPLFLVTSFFTGAGLGALDASLNSWITDLVDSNQLLGILHGCYGIGSLITPSLITYLLQKEKNPWRWNHYYVLLATVGASTLVLVAYSFRYETPKKYKYIAQKRHHESKQDITFEFEDLSSSASPQLEEEEVVVVEKEEHTASFKEALTSPLIWAFASILFIYVGGEAAFGAWLVTFLLRSKNWQYKIASHMATIFWLGLTVGRIALGFVTASYFSTELTANLVYIILSLVGYIAFWLVSFKQLSSVMFVIVFLTGAVVGPIFPTTIIAASTILPSRFQTVGIGFICAFGGGGAAGVPFVVGLLAQSSVGLEAFPGVIITMFALLAIMWFAIMAKYRNVYRKTML
ncbi:uncharacterized protein LODBEIA_P10630 [Lodderomyces beijingensis]|uniref:Major facilitator superfamily (MFS) profile domain-containing protein n=1 Tax=Lodderomyces beijingensis TaxID=1775926 RepID=A0ABP0ZF98_9ASCO